MLIYERENRRYLKSSLLEKTGMVKHGFTTKLGGVSFGKIEGFNLGFRCGDDPESVKKNYFLAASDLEIPFKSIVASRQTHSANIKVVTEDDKGKGVSRESDITETDGLITNCADIPMVIFYADCVPVLMFDTEKRVAAAIHSGWRGTAEKIAAKAVTMMGREFGTRPENIRAAIGPSIGPCCFECGKEVADLFPGNISEVSENGKYKADLWKANRKMLEECGVRPENIDMSEQCTICRSDIFYSYRCHGEATGRMGAFIMIKG